MPESYPKNIINNHCIKLNKSIKNVNEHFETESIHKLRVEYKKLRAFLRMISEEKAVDEKINIPGKLKKGYHIAGSIRDLQLQCQLILMLTKEEIKPPKAYLKLLEKNIEKLKPEFSGIPLTQELEKISDKSKGAAIPKFSETLPHNFIDANCTAIIEIINTKDFIDITMHAIRKYLKDIFYTLQELKATGEGAQLNVPRVSKKEMEYFDDFLEELGNFQDKCTSIALLDNQRLNLLNTFNRQLLLRIKKVLAIDKDEIKNDLIKKLEIELIPHLQLLCNMPW